MKTKSQVDMAVVMTRVDDRILEAFRELQRGFRSYCQESSVENLIELACDWTRPCFGTIVARASVHRTASSADPPLCLSKPIGPANARPIPAFPSLRI